MNDAAWAHASVSGTPASGRFEGAYGRTGGHLTEPVIAQKGPYVVEETARRVSWCQCGRSANQPYCDGSHKVTAIRPIVVELTENKRIAWCGCKHSGNKPYCDGTHKRL